MTPLLIRTIYHCYFLNNTKPRQQRPFFLKLLGKFSKSVFKQSEFMYYYGNAFFSLLPCLIGGDLT